MLCCVVLCCVVLCGVVLCCIVLCCVVLCSLNGITDTIYGTEGRMLVSPAIHCDQEAQQYFLGPSVGRFNSDPRLGL